MCNESVSLTNLMGGIHTLFIVGTDLAGNVARSVRWSWTVGKDILINCLKTEIFRLVEGVEAILWLYVGY